MQLQNIFTERGKTLSFHLNLPLAFCAFIGIIYSSFNIQNFLAVCNHTLLKEKNVTAHTFGADMTRCHIERK